MTNMRPASSVLLASLSPTPIAARQNYKLLMVKRSSKNRFMPSAHVFPGGVVETSDSDQKWAQMCGWAGDRKELAFRIAALREVFEEVNVLISTSSTTHVSVQEMAEWRDKVQKDASEFYNMYSHYKLRPELDLLLPYAHWITPEVEKYRYDTKFFVASLPSSMHKAAIDSQEVTSLAWLAPDEAIAAHKKGDIHLPPPTWVILSVLARVHRLDDLLVTCAKQTFYLPESSITKDTIPPNLPHPIRPLPSTQSTHNHSSTTATPPFQTAQSQSESGPRKALVMCLPGDFQYPEPSLAGKEGQVNRMTIRGPSDYAYENTELGCALSSKL